MNVAISGASGFIGSRFIELYAHKYKNILALLHNDHSSKPLYGCSSVVAPLVDYKLLLLNTANIDVFVNCSFDHTYKDNVAGIKNILKICKINNIKQLIHISTVSVYDIYNHKHINENVLFSKYNDPYTKEKIRLEKEIDRYISKCDIDITILQPSIVYGIGGNWSKYALSACKHSRICLPFKGNKKCNAVYVDDVAQAIYLSTQSPLKNEKILISGNEDISWGDFYLSHHNILSDLSLPSSCSIVKCFNDNDFSVNPVINSIFKLWYFTSLGIFFNLFTDILKRIRNRSYVQINTPLDFFKFLMSPIINTDMEPLGVTKKIHSIENNVDISKAAKLLNYYPNYTINMSAGIMKIKLAELLISQSPS